MNLTDHEIIDRIKQKDKQVFEYVFKLYRSSLCRYASLFIEDKETAEDIIQDIFFKLWINADEIKINKSFKSYLFRVVHNSCLNHIRHLKIVNKYYQEQIYFDESVTRNHPPEPYLKDAINKAIEGLPEMTKEIFTLSKLEGLKHEEISEKLQISKKTVEAHLTKASVRLKDKLKNFASIFLLICFFI